MKKITCSIFSLLFAGASLIAQNQTNTTSTPDFDEKKAYEEAIKKGIPESDRKGYVENFLKRNHHHHSRENSEIELGKIKSLEERQKLPNFYHDQASKTTYINVTPNSAYCPNAGFENMTISPEWTPTGVNLTGTYATGNATWTGGLSQGAVNTIPPGVAANNQMALMTQAPGNNNTSLGALVGYDGIAVNGNIAAIPVVAPTGGGVSMRLGNDATGSGTERVIYTMTITPQNAQFTYQYAVVLQDPLHPAGEQPFFRATFRDANGVPLTGCGQYQVDASQAATDPTFTQIQYQFESLYYKPWTIVGVDLSGWMGQVLTIEFWTADCGYGGHFGYAYIDATCAILQGTVNGYCTGSTQVALVAPPGFVGYEWNGPNSLTPIPGATDDTLIVNNPTLSDTFYVQMISAAGCTTFLQTVIVPSTLQIASLGSTPTCPGGSSGTATATATGGLLSGYDYIWSSGPGVTGTIYDTIQNVSNLPADTVYLHVESGGCPPKDTFIVVSAVPPPPQTQTVVFCNNTVTLTSPVPGLNYQWYDFFNFAVTPNGNNDSIVILSPLNGQIWSIGYNDSVTGCRDSVRFTLSQSAFNVTAAPLPSCFGGTNGGVSFSATAGFGPYEYYITGPNSYDSTNTTVSTLYQLNGLASGTYTAVINTPNCYDSLTFIVNQTAFSSVPTTTATCFGGNTGNITASSTTSNMFPYTYTINGPGGTQSNNSNNTTFTFSNLSSGTYTLTVTANGGNCVYDSVVTITQNPLPIVTATDDICPSDTTNLTSSVSGGTHQWYAPNGTPISGATSQVYNASPAVYGTYLDSAADASGCQTVYTITLTQTAFSATTPVVVNNPCYMDSVGIITVGATGGNPPYTYIWNGPGGFTGTGATNNNLNSGVYTIYAHGGNCKDTITVAVTEPPMPNDTLVITTHFCEADTSAMLYAPPGFTNYQWYYNGSLIPGATADSIFILNPEATYLNYSVTYTITPCKRKTVVIFKSIPDALFTPEFTTNVFSPNNDNKNEYFHPFYNPLVTQNYIDYASRSYTMKIYNRWGQLEFESSDYSTQWNGKNKNGKECSEGTYFWIATYVSRCGNGTETTKNGYVQLVR